MKSGGWIGAGAVAWLAYWVCLGVWFLIISVVGCIIVDVARAWLRSQGKL